MIIIIVILQLRSKYNADKKMLAHHSEAEYADIGAFTKEVFYCELFSTLIDKI